MERTKLLMGSTHSQLNSTNSERLELNRSRLHPMYRSSGPVSYGFASLETSQMLDTETICSANGSDASSGEWVVWQSQMPLKILIEIEFGIVIRKQLVQDHHHYKMNSIIFKRWSVRPKRIHSSKSIRPRHHKVNRVQFICSHPPQPDDQQRKMKNVRLIHCTKSYPSKTMKKVKRMKWQVAYHRSISITFSIRPPLLAIYILGHFHCIDSTHQIINASCLVYFHRTNTLTYPIFNQ